MTDAAGYVDGAGIDREVIAPEDGRFSFRVTADRSTDVVLAASWHPRWRVTVDGERGDVEMTATGTARSASMPASTR